MIGIDHVHAHLYSVVLEGHAAGSSNPLVPSPEYRGRGKEVVDRTSGVDIRRQPVVSPVLFPAVGLVCSGGHTALYRIGDDWRDVQLIGSTIDDAVGEAYDKVAAILGLGYPGGPTLDALAVNGDPTAIRFPRTLLDRDSLDFSFSGLKTAVLYHVRGVPRRGENVKASQIPPPTGQHLYEIAASFQAACIDVLIQKIERAAARIGARSVVIGGGVSANRGLRKAMARFPLPVFFPKPVYCTDNAAMSAGLAQVYLDAGIVAGLDLDAVTFSQFVAQPARP